MNGHFERTPEPWVIGRPGTIAAVTFAAYVIGILTERIAHLVAWPIANRSRIVPRIPTPSILWDLKNRVGARANRVDHVLSGAVIDVLVRRYWDSSEFRDSVIQRVNPSKLMELHNLIASIRRHGSTDMDSYDRHQVRIVIRDPSTQTLEAVDPKELESSAKWVEQTDQKVGILLAIVIRIEQYVDSLRDDLRLVPARLVGKEQEIYERWDRLRAESDFRLSIALPLLVLSIVLAVRFSPASLILFIPCIYLLYQGSESKTAADIQLAESIRVERIPSPPLARIKAGELLWREP